MRLALAALLGLCLAPMLALGPATMARAETISIAVAANFTDATKELAAAFEAKTGDELAPSFGATGQLYTQISQGAPFEILLAADSVTPSKAVANGFGLKGTQFTYATGKLVLFSADANLVTGADTLKRGKFNKIAVANPKTAPYGAAAIEMMTRLGVYPALAPKIVTGNDISQTYQFVETKNAELGFVALSQVNNRQAGSRWMIPQADYTPITQDAVLLTPGADDQGARAFLAFLKSPQAMKIIESFGYVVGG